METIEKLVLESSPTNQHLELNRYKLFHVFMDPCHVISLDLKTGIVTIEECLPGIPVEITPLGKKVFFQRFLSDAEKLKVEIESNPLSVRRHFR